MCYCCFDLRGLAIVVGGSGAALLDFGVWLLDCGVYGSNCCLIAVYWLWLDCGLGYWCVIFLMLRLWLWLV